MSDLRWVGDCANGTCIEVAYAPVLIDPEDPHDDQCSVMIRAASTEPGHAVCATPNEWRHFVAAVKAGDFDNVLRDR